MNTRSPLHSFRGLTPLLFALLPLLAASVGVAAEESKRPNIVIIMADDMGYSDIGCYGSEIETPNLNALAAAGTRFTQFYNTARCCPTRASLLTGLHPHQAGVGHMVQDRQLPGYRGFLNDRCVTIAEVLKKGGYRTALSGKWHVGENRPHWPVDRGFEESYSLINGAANYFRQNNNTLVRNDQRIQAPEDWYITDAISDHAVQFVETMTGGEQPLFLYVAFTAPHWPLHAPPEVIAKYRGKYKHGWDAVRRERHARMIEMGIVDAKWPLTPRDPSVPAWEDAADHDELDLRMAVYAAQIDRMDQGIGRIIEALKKQGQLENTLILFLADNGGCAEVIDRSVDKDAPTGTADSFRSYGVGWANASNTPFRRYKHWVHEGGISTPLIAHWPAVIKKPVITHQPGQLVDLMATCVDVAGAEYPREFNGKEIQPLQGRSLKPVFNGEKWDQERLLFWEHEGNRAIRRGDWKLVALHGKPWELYDLSKDRTEVNNVAADHPELVEELKELYQSWADRSSVVPWNTLPPAAGAQKAKSGQNKGKNNKAKAAKAASGQS